MDEKQEQVRDWAAELKQMMDAHGTDILRLCCLYLKDVSLAEDAAQETFIRAYKALPSFLGQSSERTWLTRIAINVCKNLLRNPWRRLRDWAAAEKLPEPSCALGAQDGDVLRAVQCLPAKYREAILLFYYQELPVKEIARLLDVPQKTVSTRLCRARARLREALKGWWME